jgi:hypothetical protein
MYFAYLSAFLMISQTYPLKKNCCFAKYKGRGRLMESRKWLSYRECKFLLMIGGGKISNK